MAMIYFRCNSGHYFADEICPWDGWSRPGFKEVRNLVAKFKSEGKAITFENLKAGGISLEIIKRLVIVEFGDPEATLEAICPQYVKANGKIKDLLSLDNKFL